MGKDISICAKVFTVWPHIQKELIAEYGEGSFKLALAEIAVLRELATAVLKEREQFGKERKPKIVFTNTKKKMTR